ncbi:putative beta-galactosidase [Rosa chinensis]|uniref:Putative beta-galactosidase n=1 Tax=Rosa chinensis TaxID=74649 RepID=A0A2P6QT32_ROSCH|nr:putative beta-galactosidase [Rosa chinensis]
MNMNFVELDVFGVDISPSESFLHGGKHPILTVLSAGNTMHVFVNDQLSGSTYGTLQDLRFTFTGDVNMHAGVNKFLLLSVAVGLPNNGPHFETWNLGVLGPVVLQGLDQGSRDLSGQIWSYKVGLNGESMNLGSPTSTSAVNWTRVFIRTQNQHPLTWYKANFNAPEGDEPLALDMGSMGKGEVRINGGNIGRYWTVHANGNCSACSYFSTFRINKCQFGCLQPTQQWYHVPRSWLKPSQNLLVVSEKLAGDFTKIDLLKVTHVLRNGRPRTEAN